MFWNPSFPLCKGQKNEGLGVIFSKLYQRFNTCSIVYLLHRMPKASNFQKNTKKNQAPVLYVALKSRKRGKFWKIRKLRKNYKIPFLFNSDFLFRCCYFSGADISNSRSKLSLNDDNFILWVFRCVFRSEIMLLKACF